MTAFSAIVREPVDIDTKQGDLNVVKDVVKDVVKELSERQCIILELIASDPVMSAKTMSEKIPEKTSLEKRVDERTIQRDLAKLKEMGILIREGGRKDGKWVINHNIFI